MDIVDAFPTVETDMGVVPAIEIGEPRKSCFAAK
jgi:hypothetical protein